MGRSPCCSKEGLNRGAWTALEDKILTAYIKAHGEGKWRSLPKRAGLKRCGKSCRLRWLNYLRPDIKRGNISGDEEELIIRLHNLLGNRWSLIAGRLPGRTDNEIKNYWNTTLAKKGKSPESTSGSSSKETSPTPSKHRAKKRDMDPKTMETTSKPSGSSSPSAAATQHQVIRTRAIRCTKVVVPPLPIPYNENYTNPLELQVHGGSEGFQGTDAEDCNNNIVLNFGCDEFQTGVEHGDCVKGEYSDNLCIADQSLPLDEAMLNDWTGSDACNLEDYGATLDLDSLAFLLDSEEWPSQENII